MRFWILSEHTIYWLLHCCGTFRFTSVKYGTSCHHSLWWVSQTITHFNCWWTMKALICSENECLNRVLTPHPTQLWPFWRKPRCPTTRLLNSMQSLAYIGDLQSLSDETRLVKFADDLTLVTLPLLLLVWKSSLPVYRVGLETTSSK